MGPLVGAILGSLGGFGSLLSSVGNQINYSSQLNAQIAEAQKNRDFNAEQAQIQRDFITQQITSQNQYNSPSSVVQRLKEAGLNPNLAYQQIGSGQQISNFQGSSASSNSSIGSSLPDLSGLGAMTGLAQQLSTIRNIDANTKNTEEDTKRISEETNNLKTHNQYLNQILNGQIKLLDSQYNLNLANTNLSAQQINKIATEVEYFETNINLLRQQARNMEITNEQMSQLLPFIVRKYAAETQMTEEQARFNVATIVAGLGYQESLTSLNYSQAEINRINAEALPQMLALDLRLKNEQIYLTHNQSDLAHQNAVGQNQTNAIQLGEHGLMHRTGKMEEGALHTTVDAGIWIVDLVKDIFSFSGSAKKITNVYRHE